MALSPEQKRVLDSGVGYFNIDVCLGGTGGGSAGATSGSWQSGLQPPYILEQFVIEVLKDVAAKRGVAATNAVTQEHVIALLAFAWGEGGDINNPQVFNPLNTGINDPALIAGAPSVSGVQSFKSFDAGVEATARTMVGSNQSRLADAVTDPTSTAEQFMETLTYFNRFPGNKFWASASLPPRDGIYYQGRLQLVAQVRNNYDSMASTGIGTPVKEAAQNIKYPHLLQFHGGAGIAGGATGSNCFSGAVAGNIAQTAVNFSWPKKAPESVALIPKPEYKAALQKYNPTSNTAAFYYGADCGSFVGTVMIASGADPNYPHAGTSRQEAYVRAHPEKYDVVNRVSNTADLLPGDILIVNLGSGAGANGHTYIYVGPQPPNGFDAASASGGDRMANLGKAILSDSRGSYLRARLK